MLNILYCSYFRSHRTHRELVRLASEHNCRINAVPWEETEDGRYTGPFPVDGVISHLEPVRYGRLMRHAGDVPSVTLHALTSSKIGIPGAVCDHVAAGRMAAEHYLKLGFTRCSAFVDTARYDTFDQRFAGYREVISEAAHEEPILVALPEQAQHSYERVLHLFGEALRSLPVPLAIMAASDRVAVKLMDACMQNELSIPAQVAICGFDNDPIVCDLAPTPLSSVDTDPESQAQEAFRLLLSLIEGEPAPKEPIIIPPKSIVVRRSSGLQAQESSTVAKAVGYIHEHASDPELAIPEITEYVGVSRTTLFKAFRMALSVTPLQYITNLRVDRARRLLRETVQKINEIRPQCGFSTDYQMYRAFKRTLGKTPGECR